MAQLCDPLPVAIPLAATSLATSVPTRVGVAVSFAIGLPSWPELLEPQQYTALVFVTPQTWAKPVEICSNTRPPDTATGDDESFVFAGLPNFVLLLPQQYA
jgi:hypothetical protein